MQKCPYCAEEIQDEAIVCMYCGRDLAPAQTPISMPLSWSDLDQLTKASLSGYTDPGKHPIGEQLTPAIQPITKKWMLHVVKEWAHHHAATDQEIQRRALLVSMQCMKWGLLCFCIGAEAGNRQISDAEVPRYLAACGKPLFLDLTGYLSDAVDNGWMKDKRKLELVHDLENILDRQSAKLASYGRDRCKEMKPQFAPGESSPGSLLLRRLVL